MKKFLYRLVLLICICVFGYSAFNLYKIFMTKKQVSDEVEEMEEKSVKKDNGFEVDWDSLKATNSDIIAWIYVPDCDISFPVVQTTDNSFYLNHSSTKEENYLGAIFMDYANASDFSNPNSIIYGHSVDGTGGMFTALKNFKDQSFFSEHPTIYLFTPNGNYKGNVLAFAETEDGSSYYDIYYDNKDEHINELKNNALYSNDVNTEGNLLTLSTCNLDYGFNSIERYVLVSVLEPTTEAIEVK